MTSGAIIYTLPNGGREDATIVFVHFNSSNIFILKQEGARHRTHIHMSFTFRFFKLLSLRYIKDQGKRTFVMIMLLIREIPIQCIYHLQYNHGIGLYNIWISNLCHCLQKLLEIKLSLCCLMISSSS